MAGHNAAWSNFLFPERNVLGHVEEFMIGIDVHKIQ